MKKIHLVIISFLAVFQSCSCNYDAEFEKYSGLKIDDRYKKQYVSCLDAIGEGGSEVGFNIKDKSNIQSVVNELDSLIELNKDGNVSVKKEGNKYSIEFETSDNLIYIRYYFDSETGQGKYTYFEE
ncbi:hypothetical protein EP331_15925 [bacterium]|nr:MAG: hypothetical protein EP331_15925 [bacterium]